jgi:SAM-dependent methyltransferase
MARLKQLFKNLLRKNKYIEIFSYLIQNYRKINFSGEANFGDIDEHYAHIVNRAKLYFSNYDGDLSNKVVLEVGTGLTKAQMLYMIKHYKLKKVYCYDRFNCLSKNDEKIIKKYKLIKYSDRLKYFYGTNDEIKKYIEDGSIDYIVSKHVLEHVDDLNFLFENLSKVLKHNGKMYHQVDLRPHNRFKKYGELYFHTFSDKLWRMMGSNIGSPNRKLVKDYMELFESFNLRSEIKIIEKFDNDELQKAKKYLKINSIEEYKASVVEFELYKK